MRQNDLARGMFAQLQSIAGINGLTWITHVELVVGTKHGVSAEGLADDFEGAFEGTNFEGAEVEIRIVGPMEEIKSPGRDEMMTTNGWELLITKLDGRRSNQ